MKIKLKKLRDLKEGIVMDRLTKLAAEIRLSRAVAKSFKEANELMDKMIKLGKKPQGNV